MPRSRMRLVSISADRIWVIIALGAAGAIIGVAIVFFPYVALTEECLELIGKPEFLVWLLINCVQMAFWAIVATPVYRSVMDLRSHFKGNVLEIVLSLVILLILFSASPITTSKFYLPITPEKVFKALREKEKQSK